MLDTSPEQINSRTFFLLIRRVLICSALDIKIRLTYFALLFFQVTAVFSQTWIQELDTMSGSQAFKSSNGDIVVVGNENIPTSWTNPGSTGPLSTGQIRYWRFNNLSNILLEKTIKFDTSSIDYGSVNDIIELQNGDIVGVGSYVDTFRANDSVISANTCPFFIRFDKNGNVKALRTEFGDNNGYLKVLLTMNGKIYVRKPSFSDLVFELDFQGNRIDSIDLRLFAPPMETPRSLHTLSDGRFLLVTTPSGIDSSSYQILSSEFNPVSESAHEIDILHFASTVVSGLDEIFVHSGGLSKLDNNLSIHWQVSVDSIREGRNQFGNLHFPTSDGGCLLAELLNPGILFFTRVILMKYDSMGHREQICTKWEWPIKNIRSMIELDDGYVILGDDQGDYDQKLGKRTWLVKVRKDSLILSTSDEQQINQTNSGILLFPNPVDDYLNIRFPEFSSYQLMLVSEKGQSVLSLETDRTLSLIVDLSSIQQGLYYLISYDTNNIKKYFNIIIVH